MFYTGTNPLLLLITVYYVHGFALGTGLPMTNWIQRQMILPARLRMKKLKIFNQRKAKL